MIISMNRALTEKGSANWTSHDRVVLNHWANHFKKRMEEIREEEDPMPEFTPSTETELLF